MPYETVEVNPLNKREIKPWSGDYRKVPIAMLDGEQINDSPVIASRLLDSMAATDHVPKDQLAAFRSKVGHREGLRIHAHVLPRRDRSAGSRASCCLLPPTRHQSSLQEAMEWATWSDTKLSVLLFPNITRSWSEAYQAPRCCCAGPLLLLCVPGAPALITLIPSIDYIH